MHCLQFVDSPGHPASQSEHLVRAFCTPNPHKTVLYDELTERLTSPVSGKALVFRVQRLLKPESADGGKEQTEKLILSEPDFSESLRYRQNESPYVTPNVGNPTEGGKAIVTPVGR